MTSPDRRVRRIVVAVWIGLAVVLWNGLYDFRISFGIRDYLMHVALHELGRGPAMELSEMMAFTVRESVKFATLWAVVVLAAAFGTIRALTRTARPS